jgi:hypothetical protein
MVSLAFLRIPRGRVDRDAGIRQTGWRMRRATLALALLFLACSKEENAASLPVDSAVVDSEPPVDSATEVVDAEVITASCIGSLDAGFACRSPKVRAGRTVCSDAAIRALVVCFGTDSKACSDATAQYPACATCVKDWFENDRIDFAACIHALDPTGTCATTVQCTLDCLDAVCATCDSRVGSGSTSMRSARDDCERTATESTGACWDVAAKDYVACAVDARFSICFPRGGEQLLPFFRGACRDGGDYSRAYEEQVLDAAAD